MLMMLKVMARKAKSIAKVKKEDDRQVLSIPTRRIRHQNILSRNSNSHSPIDNTDSTSINKHKILCVIMRNRHHNRNHNRNKMSVDNIIVVKAHLMQRLH